MEYAPEKQIIFKDCFSRLFQKSILISIFRDAGFQSNGTMVFDFSPYY